VEKMKTNWDEYYSKPAKTASITRKISARKLANIFHTYTQSSSIFFEFGGANSCFYQGIVDEFKPEKYFILDNNTTGLKAFRNNYPDAKNVNLIEADVLKAKELPKADIVFSVGLIEHFSPVDTAKAIASHFQAVKPDGIVVITFPTPTWLYRLSRKIIEFLGLWGFPDERPLSFSEVESAVKPFGEIIFSCINWPIILTQGIIVLKPKV
jgi:SAM-dependent methyltransferase